MTNQQRIEQLVAERNAFIDEANKKIAWYNGRIYQLQQKRSVSAWLRQLLGKHESA